MNEIEWVKMWFKNNVGIEENVLVRNINNDYFSLGWIDSFQFISLVSDIETSFKFSFSNDEFQDRTFATITGLARIINNKNNAKK